MKKNKNFKKILFVVMLLIMPIAVFAAAASYTSTLYISPGSSVTGSTRNYTNRNHKIGIKSDSFPDSGLAHKLIIRIGTKNVLGSFSSQAQKTASLTLGSTVTTTMGNVGSGNKAYQFIARSRTSGNASYYSGVNSSYVRMTSY